MAHAAWDRPEYKVSYTGNPTTNASKLKSLKHAGTLLTAKVNKVAVLLPDIYEDDSSGDKKEIFQSDMHELFLGGCNIDDDMAKLGAEAFAFVNVARFAVPLRIGLALSTTPWVRDNVVQKIPFLAKKQDAQ